MTILSAFPSAQSQGASITKPKEYLAFIGTYTDGTQSKGIYAFRLNPSSGELTPLGLAAESKNPSFLAVDPDNRFLFAVNELDTYEGQSAGSVSAFSLDRSSGKLGLLKTVSTRGPGPCHLAVDHTGRLLVVANYSGGSVAAFPIGADGRIGEASYFDQHTGKGVNPERQEKAHAHSTVISPNNKFVFSADLGLDKIFVYRMDPAAGKLTPNDPPTAAAQPGAGPRHIAIQSKGHFAYVINEMQNTVAAYQLDDNRGTLKEIQTISTLPGDFKGENTTAEIQLHPSGKFLYGSNRGNDSIAVFGVNPKSGKLTAIQHVSTQGKTPRGFAIDPTGRFLLAANQQSNNLVVFQIDPNTGKLTPTGKTVSVGAPVCVLFVAAK